MDGASKFVRGDAIAGILITLINIIGGLVIGMVARRHVVHARRPIFSRSSRSAMDWSARCPAFLISLAAGLLVTRSSSDTNLPSEFLRQLFSRPQALAVTGGFLGHVDFHELADRAAGADRRQLRGHGRDALAAKKS